MHKTCENEKGFGKTGNGALKRKATGLAGMKVRVMLVREGPVAEYSVSSPKEAFDLLASEAKGLDREQFWRIDLDARSRAVGFEVVSIGTLSSALVHPREVFKGAILNNAAGIIIAHNHPSQEADPSPEDKDTTRRISRAGEIIGIPLLDHVIVTDERFFSFKEAGLL